MKKDHFLDRFLTAVENGELPTQEDLHAVADALKEADSGTPFKTAFDRKGSGRKPDNPVYKYFRDLDICADFLECAMDTDKSITEVRWEVAHKHDISQSTVNIALRNNKRLKPLLDDIKRIKRFAKKKGMQNPFPACEKSKEYAEESKKRLNELQEYLENLEGDE